MQSEADTDYGKVKEILERGAAQMGQVYGPSIIDLLGASPSTRGKELAFRRKSAHKTFCEAMKAQSYPAPVKVPTLGSFQSHKETPLIRYLAEHILHIANGEFCDGT
jgi:hypothetical protein